MTTHNNELASSLLVNTKFLFFSLDLGEIVQFQLM